MGITLDGRSCLLGALLLLTLPFPWLLAAVLAALFHEFCHLTALFITGTPIYGIRIGVGGTEIETAPMQPKSEFFCAAAGPLGSLFLLFFLRTIPRIALCAAVQGLFNLLPLFPMDGGRILRSFTALLLPEIKADRLSSAIEKSALAVICMLTCVFSLRVGFLPVLIAGMLLFKGACEKYLAKKRKSGYNSATINKEVAL